jgi:hypothetical protein
MTWFSQLVNIWMSNFFIVHYTLETFPLILLTFPSLNLARMLSFIWMKLYFPPGSIISLPFYYHSVPKKLTKCDPVGNHSVSKEICMCSFNRDFLVSRYAHNGVVLFPMFPLLHDCFDCEDFQSSILYATYSVALINIGLDDKCAMYKNEPVLKSPIYYFHTATIKKIVIDQQNILKLSCAAKAVLCDLLPSVLSQLVCNYISSSSAVSV